MNAQFAKGNLMNENISFANKQPQRDFLLLFSRRKKKECFIQFPLQTLKCFPHHKK